MDQEEKLRQEIMQDAERKAKRSVDRAKRDARKLLDTARAEGQAQKESRMAAAEKTADEKERAILASIEYEKRKGELLGRETVIQEVLQAALKKAAVLDDNVRSRGLDQLLDEALQGLGGAGAVIRCAKADETIVKDLVRQREETLSVKVEPGISGGLLVEDKAGKRFYDNTYTARLARLEDEWRAVAFAVLSAEEHR